MSANVTVEIDRYVREYVHYKALQLVGRPGIRSSDVPDVEQELILELLEALPTFDASKATHGTFVRRIVERGISRVLRHRQAERRAHSREACSLDEAIETAEESAEVVHMEETLVHDRRKAMMGQERDLQKGLERALDLAALMAKLPEDSRAICEHLKTHSVAETARRLGIGRTSLCHQLRKIRRFFEAEGMREYL